MPINPKYPFELVHSVEEAEAPTDGRAILYVADEFVADLVERGARIRPLFINPPDMTKAMERKRRARARGLLDFATALEHGRIVHDPDAR